MENDKNYWAEVTAAVEILKKNHTPDLVSLADLEYITQELKHSDGDRNEEAHVEWAEKDECDNGSYVEFITD